MKISYRKLAAVDSRQYRAIRLESLKLHPESFGSSFAEQRKLPKLMFEKALEQIILGVTNGNMSAIRVYEQAGFQIVNPEGREIEVNDNELGMIIRRDD